MLFHSRPRLSCHFGGILFLNLFLTEHFYFKHKGVCGALCVFNDTLCLVLRPFNFPVALFLRLVKLLLYRSLHFIYLLPELLSIAAFVLHLKSRFFKAVNDVLKARIFL